MLTLPQVKTLKNRPAETKLLGQQVSEMLGAALKYRSVHPQEYYTVFLTLNHVFESPLTHLHRPISSRGTFWSVTLVEWSLASNI